MIRDNVGGCCFEQLCVGALPAQVDMNLLHLGAPPFTIIDRYEFVHSLTGTADTLIESGTFPVAVLIQFQLVGCFLCHHMIQISQCAHSKFSRCCVFRFLRLDRIQKEVLLPRRTPSQQSTQTPLSRVS